MWLFFLVSRSKKATTKPSLKVPAVATLIAPAGISAVYPAVRPAAYGRTHNGLPFFISRILRS
jgi:hypothetical protein